MTLQRVDPSDAQEAARRILSERRFRPPDVPRPLEGVLEPLGEWLESAWDEIFELLDAILPGETSVVWTVLGAAVVLTAVALAARLAANRAARVRDPSPSATASGRITARDIEALAEKAERSGDFAEAIRHRFRAGLLRLEAAGRIRGAESTTSREVARRLRSARFDQVAAIFDQIVYGGRPATAADAETHRAGWEALLRAPREARRG
jgi:hypothetical protein